MTHARELQMQVNDVLSCRGKCQGCVLTEQERRATTPDMSEEMLKLASDRMTEYAASIGTIDRVNVIFGIGDHVLFGAEYLARLHELGSRAVLAGKPREPQKSVVFFSTSLVGRPAQVMETLTRTRSLMKGPVPFIPQVVLDGRLMQAAKFGPMWREMVTHAKEMFGRVDLVTNLSGDAVDLMKPTELISFAELNDFDEVSVVWSPTLANAPQTLDGSEQIARWIVEFDKVLRSHPQMQTTYRPVIEKLLWAARGDRQARDTITDTVFETLSKAFDIEHDGSVSPKFEAVGDINHHPRHGFPTIGNIAEAPIRELIDRSCAAVSRRILSEHAKGACASCDVAAICAGTGYHVATHVARRTAREANETCPHIARSIINHILSDTGSRSQVT